MPIDNLQNLAITLFCIAMLSAVGLLFQYKWAAYLQRKEIQDNQPVRPWIDSF